MGLSNAAGLADLMPEFASRIKNLDLESFRQCMENRRTLDRLKEADEERRSRKITSQPVFEIGGQRLVGIQSFERMSELIEAVLK